MATDIGTRIKRARERKHWTQRELAGKLQVSIKTVDNWENGRTSPKNRIGALQDELDVDLEKEADAEQPSLIPEATRNGIMTDPDLTDDERKSILAVVGQQLASERGAAPSSVRAAGGASRRRPASLAGATGRR